ncbi:hypothetical protein [Paenibacillus amylolyticus]|uniref:hypothetical protein n=1 Tax=Paenibacillus amylolyticus TaxID=1451 RepID=UPI003EB998D6
MAFVHLLLEVYCLYGMEDGIEYGDIPSFCKCGAGQPGYHCMENDCPFVAHTDAPFEIAYAGESGEVPDIDSWMGFGGDMEPEAYSESEIVELKEMWKEICKEKIQEAYMEYMLRSKLKNN